MPKTRSIVIVSMLAAITCSTGAAPAQKLPKADVVDVPAVADGLCVSNVFQSHMVLQRDKPIAIWGWAAPGEEVAVSFGRDRQATRAAADRSWRVTLAAQPANRAPQQLLVQGRDARLVLDDVLIGDVWVLGGQSNMEFELAKVENGALEIVSANFPQIRILTVPYAVGPEPVRSFPRLHEWSDWFGQHFRKGDWNECTPAIARELSAIGYAFARRVHMASQVPIGVIDASRGGTTAETWTPLARLRELDEPFLRQKLADWDQRVATWDARKDLEQRIAQNRRWVEQQVAAGKPVPADRQRDPSDLRPGPIADANHPGHCYAGMIGPLVGLAIKGVLWHQGYNNAFDGMPGVRLYRAVLPEMIRAWRDAFGDPQLPFGILSQCTEGTPQTRADYCEKMLDTGIYVREVHWLTFLDRLRAGDTQIGFASTFDLRRRWYHPQVKIPAGERIARWALATQYGFGGELEWKPPLLVDMVVRDDSLVLKLDTPVSDPEDGAIEGFAIAGDDRRFQVADVGYLEVGKDDRGQPRLDQKQLVLKSPLVPAPKHFRYAWGRSPLGNLQATGNKDLPFPAQRSDDWDMGDVPLGVLGEGWSRDTPLTGAQRNRVLQALRQDDVRRRLAEAEAVLREHGGGRPAPQPDKK
jgi:sialate O-acetylesterase